MLYQAVSINGQPMLISVSKHTKSYEANFPNINQSDNKAGHQGGEGLNDTKTQRIRCMDAKMGT
jgi:hypothetical protein